MPRSLKEIKQFITGTIHNASERDISDDTAAFSLNVDPMSENGSLDAIKNDRIVLATDNTISSLMNPVSWGRDTQYSTAGNYNTSSVIVPDIGVFGDKDDISDIHFIGTKGRKEKLKVTGISPWWERVIVNSTLNVTYTPATAITSSQVTIPFLTDTNAIGGNAAAGNTTISGFTDGVASIQVDTDTASTLVTKTIIITSPDGFTKTYTFYNDGSGASGTLDGSIVRIQLNGLSADEDFAAQIELAVDHANGHNGRIGTSRDDDEVTLTYIHRSLDNYLFEGDYLVLTTSMNASTAEYIRIDSVDSTGTFNVTRNILGSPLGSYATSTEYQVWSSRLTIDGRQLGTTRGILVLSNWSNYSGNNIGGSGTWMDKADHTSEKEDLGLIDTSSTSQTITFSAANKTITFANLGSQTSKFNEGDTVTFYYGADGEDEPNNGKSFKILKSEVSSGDRIWTVDTAPTDDTESADTVYIEANLIKNHTFHHSSDEVNPTVNVGSGLDYAVNNWQTKHYKYTDAGGGESATLTNAYLSGLAKSKVSRTNTGGYWEDTTADHGADNAANYYPFNVNDAYINIEAEYKDTNLNLAVAATASDGFIAVGDKSIFSVNDIIKLTNDSAAIEYMRITSMTENKLYVERALYGTTAVAHEATNDVYKGINVLISQDVSSDKLKVGQPYILTFYAKDLYASSLYGYGAVSVRINGGYFNDGGEWQKASLDNGMGYYTSIANIQQENRWIDFEKLHKVNNDVAYNADETQADSSLDTTWRRFELPLYLPKGIDFSTDMNIEFSSRGPDGSQIGIDLVDLSELTYIVPVSSDSKVDSIGMIDNAGKKDLVLYDNKSKELRVVKDFDQDADTPYLSGESIEKSPFAASEVSSSDGKATFASKNRETHIGFGPKNEDSSPQWLGYLNSKAFGIDSSSILYQDEDTVHSYDTTGLVAMYKIVLAGEHENLTATFSGSDLTIEHDGHALARGDNIVVREWLDTDNSWDGNGVWVVTDVSDANEFVCQRIDALDADPAITLSNNLVSYRPFYYYGIRDGDNHLYRILPHDLYTNASTISTKFTRGLTEKSLPLNFVPTSIATCYNKKDDGTGGGRVYLLTSNGEIKTMDTNIAYDKWTKLNLTLISTLTPYYKAYKWSNDSTIGDINGDTAVFGSLAEESTPTIAPAGIISDIIETKGTTSTFDYDATANNSNQPNDFDTRLWIQFRPNSGETFSASDRFLFCGLTNSGNTDASSNVYFGDRTPPTNFTFPKRTRWTTGGLMYHCGPGLWTDGSSMDSGADIGDFPGDKLWDNALFAGSRHGGSHQEGYKKEKFAQFAVRDTKDGYTWYGGVAQTQGSPWVNFGQNVGWEADGGNLPSIQVIKYGLFAMGDNNCDGVIDGTGVVTCSNQSLTQVDGNKIFNQNLGPYGYEHETVCSHVVGLIGGADTPWIREWGCVDGISPTGSSGDYYYTGVYGRAPENMSAEKLVFICSDVHFGDKHFENIQSDGHIPVENDSGAYLTSVTWEGIANGATKVEVGSTKGFKPGMTLYINGKHEATIMKIDNATQFTVNDMYSSSASSNDVFPFSLGKANWVSGQNADGSNIAGNVNQYGGVSKQHYHFAYDDDEPLNSDIFTNAEEGGGHYSKTWWTVPDITDTNGSVNSNHQAPGILHRVDRLNYRAGYMIRPFDLDDNTFEDMILGRGVYVDAPVRPDVIYHSNNSSAIHDNQGGNVNNQFASKIFITAPVEDTYDEVGKSKMYICDPTFEYPDILHQVEKQSYTRGSSNTTSTNEWNGTETSYEPHLYGKIDGYITTSANTTSTHISANQFPVIQIASADCVDEKGNFAYMGTNNNNGFAGQMLTIVDSDTGTMQTRQIVSSNVDSGNLFLGVHFPFGHTPATNDLFYIWSHKYACTSPIRLFREKELDFSLSGVGDNTVAFKADPILSAPIYKTSGDIATIDGNTTLITVDTDTVHGLSTNDVVVISGTTNYDDLGPQDITVTDPKQFTIADTFTDVASESTGTWTLQEVNNSDSSVANPIKFDINTPLIKATFGGLDMRKTRSLATHNTDITNDSGTRGYTDVNGDHFMFDGDTVTMKRNSGATDDWEGVYPITKKDADEFYITNTTNANDTDAWDITTNQWEGFLVATTGTGNTAEIRAGFNVWDTGQSQGNIIRNDNSTASDSNKYLSTTEAAVLISSPSLGDETNDFFLKNNEYEYKISLRYDGYQEGPLSTSTWSFKDTVKTRARLRVDISILDFSKRLTQVCLYRRDNKDSFFRLVQQIDTAGGWNYDGHVYKYSVDDSGPVRASYEARTARSEVLDTIKLKYGISAEIDGYLFAGNCSHENIENASNQIFRSKPGMYSVFDYAFDFLQLKSKPTALANFSGRLYAFDKSNIYRINQHSLAIEDIYEGIGCLSKDSVIVTEYGMFFADKNGAYLHDGQSPKKISGPIEQGGGTSHEWGGTDNIRDISWKTIVGNSLFDIPYVTFDSNISSVLFFVTYNDYNATTGLSLEKQYVWSYNLIKNRWDLWELSQDASIGVPFIGDKGAVFIPVDNVVYEYRGGSSKRDYTWLSKKMTMEEDSILKVYNKVKVNGTTDNLLQGGAYKESSDRLLIKTSLGDVASSDITFSTTSGNHSEYKLKSANKKGRWIQFKLEDMTSPVDSLGIIYRRKSTK